MDGFSVWKLNADFIKTNLQGKGTRSRINHIFDKCKNRLNRFCTISFVFPPLMGFLCTTINHMKNTLTRNHFGWTWKPSVCVCCVHKVYSHLNVYPSVCCILLKCKRKNWAFICPNLGYLSKTLHIRIEMIQPE